MGMGEPMLNYDRVIQAARILSESCGMAIGGKAITISTAGIVPAIRRFTAEGHIYRLVVSLNSADPVQRRELMPVEKAFPTPELLSALWEYHEATGRRAVLAWTMIAGVNTRPKDAEMLADLTRGLPVKLDLIEVNDATGHSGRHRRRSLACFAMPSVQNLAYRLVVATAAGPTLRPPAACWPARKPFSPHFSTTVCHCLEQAVPGQRVTLSTACSKQWHTVGESPRMVKYAV